MGNAARVTVVEGVRDLDPDVDDFTQPQRLFANQAEQIRATHHRHHEEKGTLIPSEVVDRHDRGMIHLSDELCFALETLFDLSGQISR